MESSILYLGILGSLLVGLGIVLLVAHNWDEMSRQCKLSLLFLPLACRPGRMSFYSC